MANHKGRSGFPKGPRNKGVNGAIVIPLHPKKPSTRSDCEFGPRPCPWVSCRHHLYVDITIGGKLRINFPNLEIDELVETCSLDVADEGESILKRVGSLLNLTRERIRQIEAVALKKLRNQFFVKELTVNFDLLLKRIDDNFPNEWFTSKQVDIPRAVLNKLVELGELDRSKPLTNNPKFITYRRKNKQF